MSARATDDFSIPAARLHARLPVHRNAIARAVTRVREALAASPGVWAVSCSGGKDSTVLLDLAVEAGWRGPVFHFTYRGDYELEQRAAARDLADRHGLPFDTIEVVGEFEAFERAGGFFAVAVTAGQKAAVRWWQGKRQPIATG